MDFSEALDALKDGHCVKRVHWGGYWFYTKEVFLSQDPAVLTLDFKRGMIVAVLKDNAGYAPAQAYQEDLLAEDWEIVE